MNTGSNNLTRDNLNFRQQYAQTQRDISVLAIPISCSCATAEQLKAYVEASKEMSALCEHSESDQHPVTVLLSCYSRIKTELKNQSKHNMYFIVQCQLELVELRLTIKQLCSRVDNGKLSFL